MKTSLIIVGVIFIVVGGLLYFIPIQTAQATTTTVDEDSADTRTSYASVSVPRSVTYAILLIGFILLALGFVLTDAPASGKSSESSTTETKEDVETDDGTKHKISREHIVQRTRARQ